LISWSTSVPSCGASAMPIEASDDDLEHVVDALDTGLDHREFVAAEPRDQIAVADAAPDPSRHRLQQLVADMVAERVVDALEFVDVDIEQGELLAARDLLQLAFHLLAEQYAVGQVGERVVMGEMRDLLVRAPPLGDVVDDVDEIADVAAIVADTDPRRGDIALAERLAFPDVLVLDQNPVGEGFFVVRVDDLG
jgi:hypothetical protein